jgi:hypothetical protein
MRGILFATFDQCMRIIKRSQENEPTMSSPNVTTNETCCDNEDTEFPEVALTAVSLMIFGLCALIFIFSFFFGICRKEANLSELGEDVPSQESAEDLIIKRKESLSDGLIVKEWVPLHYQPVESTEGGDLDTPLSEGTVQAPQPPAPRINSSPVSCAIGSEDCESLAGEEEEEMAGCAICLCQFKPQQLVCESNNPSCRHVFHKDCMIDWLMKNHDECPMCREVYLLKTVQ